MAASQQTTAPVNKPVSLVPVDGRPGYFKLVDLPDLFPVLPASAATLLRDVTVEEAVSLFQYLEGKGVDASQALADAMGSIQEAQEANKRTQDTNQAWMLNHTLQPLEVSAWPDDLRQALERGCWMRSRTPPSGGHQGEVRPLHPEAQRGAEPVEPGGVAGRGARSGDTGPPKGAWPRGGPAGLGGG